MENKYYIYLDLTLSGIPFYVGKGSGRRAYRKDKRSKFWNSVATKYGYDTVIIDEGLTEDEAFELEIKYINQIGRRDQGKGTLVNHTDGGEGTSGHEPWNKGKVCPQLSGDNNYFYGKDFGRKGKNHHQHNKPHSDETKAKTSNTLKERYSTQEHHLKGKVAHNKGVKRPDLTGKNAAASKAIKVNDIIYGSITEYLRINNISTTSFYRKRKSGKLIVTYIDEK